MSTALAFAVFAPACIVAMIVLHRRALRREERRKAQRFADDVEFWMVVRNDRG